MSFIGSIIGGGGQQTPPPKSTQPSGQADGQVSGNDGNDAGAGSGGVNEPGEGQAASGTGSNAAGSGGGSRSGDGSPARASEAASASTGSSGKLVTAPDATPYVAPPTVTAVDVEAAAKAAEADARTFAQAAVDRMATEELIASIQPAPENAPSLREDVGELRAVSRPSVPDAFRPEMA